MKRLFISLVAVLSLSSGVFALAPQTVLADAKSEVCRGVGATTGGGCTDTSGSVKRIVSAIINVFSIIIGIVAVIMIMYGGFKYVTAAGDSNNITSAKNTIVYAIVGLVVAAISQFIVQFVLNAVD